MADTFLGLVMEIGADPSKAAEALRQFEQATGRSFDAAKAKGKELDTSLLTNRESVRLLSEEMGVHLPRAVSGAIVQMLPEIQAFGGVFLAAFAVKELPSLIRGIQDATDAMGGFGKEVKATLEEAKDLKEVQKAMHMMPPNLTALGGALTSTIPKFSAWKAALAEAHDAEGQWIAGVKSEIQAIQGDLMANVQAFTTGLAGLIAGRKAQAGAEAAWETARGIALLAEGTWPPNPAAILAAGLHFEAAAQCAMLAGSGSGRRGAAGAGASRGVEHGGYEGGRTDYALPPPTLAPGAGGRFGSPGPGSVGVHGSSDFHAFVAKAVTEAANRGYTVVATTSQRGAPVGH